MLTYAGNGTYLATSKVTTFTVSKKASSLTAVSTSTVYFGNNVSISGKLVSGKTAIANAKVVINVNNKNLIVRTDSNGKYKLVTATRILGSNKVKVTYAGNGTYLASSATTNFTVKKKTSKITVNNISTVYVGDTITISGKLTAANAAVSNAKIFITLNNKNYKVITDSSGNYKKTITITSNGKYNIKVTYAGSNGIYNTSASKSFTANKKTSVITVGSTKSVSVGSSVSVYGKLSAQNIGLSYANVTITVGSKKYTVKTSQYGNYNFKFTAATTGNQTITASYGGTNVYSTSKASTTFLGKN